MCAAVTPVDNNHINIPTTLRHLKLLRSNVSYIFEGLAEGLKSSQGDNGKEKAFILNLQKALQSVNTNLRDLENASSNLVVPPANPTVSNSSLLSQDPAQDRSSLYLQLIQSYKWTDKVREFASHATQILGQNQLKRTVMITSKRMRKAPQNSHNISLQLVDQVIANCLRQFADLQIDVDRPYGTSSILQVSLGKTLKAIIILRSLIIEWVVVKAYNEELHTEDGKIDIWSSSRYKVFNKVTDHANAAMLHYYAPFFPEAAIRSFMIWLHSYSSLFTAPCHRCGSYLQDFLPPTWRDFRTLEAFHDACR